MPVEKQFKRMKGLTGQTESASVRIRLATRADGACLAELSTQLGYPSSSEEVDERLVKVLSSGGAAVFVGEIDGRVTGWVEVHLRPPLVVDGGEEAEVMGLVVDAGMRRSGLGRKLMDEAARWAQTRGCSLLRVRTNVVRQDAQAFYERLGYSKLKTQIVYRKALK